MPRYVGVSSRTEVIDGAAYSALSVNTEVTNVDRNTLDSEITVTDFSRAAMQAQNKRIYIQLFIDDGRGYVTEVLPHEVGASLTIRESLDGWSDQLNFSLVGRRWSPFLSNAVRGKHKVEVWVTYGIPGYEYTPSVPTFSGRIAQATFQAYPPVTHVTALDEAIVYSEQKVDFSLEPNSKRTRLSALLEILGQGSPVPIGRIDIEGDGGTITKSVSTPPDSRKLEFIREFLEPTDSVLWFSDSKFNAVRFRVPNSTDVSLSAAEVALPASIMVPATATANRIDGVTVKFETKDVNGDRIEIKTEIIRKEYSPQAWVYKTLVGSGDISGPNPSGQPQYIDRVWKKIVTMTKIRGNVVIFQQVDEFGWGSPQATKQRLVDNALEPTLPTVEPRIDRNIYQYPDGTWHIDAQETFRLMRRSLMWKDLNADNFVVRQTEEQYFYHFINRATFRVQGDEEVFAGSPGDAVPLDENGNGVYGGQETMGVVSSNRMEGGLPASSFLSHPDASVETEWTIDSEGLITTNTIVSREWGPGAPKFQGQDGAYRYGLQSRKYYGQSVETYDGASITRTVSYSDLDEDHYVVNDLTEQNDGTYTRKISTGSGSRPRAEQVQPDTVSQEIRYSFTDGVRASLNGVIPEAIHHELCENDSEIRRVVMAAIREKSAWTITIPMPVDGRIHKNMWCSINLPDVGITPGLKFHVWAVSREFSRFRQELQLKYYPPEVL